MTKKFSDLNLRPSDISCSREDFLESEAIINDKNLSRRSVSKKVAKIVLWFGLLKEELGLKEEESDLKSVLSRLEESDNLVYLGLARKIEGILWENVTIKDFHDLIQWNIDIIAHAWAENRAVSDILRKKGSDRDFFENNIGKGALRYIVEVLNNPEYEDTCGTLQLAVQYFQKNGISLDEIYLICNELKYEIKHFLYENTVFDPHRYGSIDKEVDDLLSRNFQMMAAYITGELISSKWEAIRELEEVMVSRNELQNIINALNNSAIVQIVGKDGIILDINERSEDITGLKKHEMVWQKVNHSKSWLHCSKFWSHLWRTILSGEVFRGVISNKTADGFVYWTDTIITPYKDLEGKIEKFIVVRHDVTDLIETRNILEKKINELRELKQGLTEENGKLMALSNTDALTGLQNRRYFDYILEHEVRNSHITGNAISLVLIDIDNFKKINDTYGHDVGDIVLKKLGELVNAIKRQTDVSARYGWEEFTIILSGTKLEWAALFAEKLRKLIKSEVFKGDDYEFSVTASIGVAQVNESEMPTSLFKRTDKLLYEAKHSGKDKVCS